MSCSLCGEVCRCVPGTGPAEDGGWETGVPGSASVIVNGAVSAAEPVDARSPETAPEQEPLLPSDDASSWRREVSERLNRYHARRRPRPPRYPSLRLKFDPPETRWAGRDAIAPSSSAQATAQPSPVVRQAVAVNYAEPAPGPPPVEDVRPSELAPLPAPERKQNENTGKLIEFPRTNYTPTAWANDLAEPILDRPRILEAPEIVPPPPALGGMTIEEATKPEPERRPGIDMPLQSAPVSQRLLAGLIDGVLVVVAVTGFGAIFYRLVRFTPAPTQIAALGATLLVVFWAAYQYLLVVHSGTTPGLRSLSLQIRRFDGGPVTRKTRRARVLCALLSATSLGLGYAWHFLDEDGLCWHERVTRTHIASCPKHQ
jgi:uncharacterized RDD family membrane protein YckC